MEDTASAHGVNSAKVVPYRPLPMRDVLLDMLTSKAFRDRHGLLVKGADKKLLEFIVSAFLSSLVSKRHEWIYAGCFPSRKKSRQDCNGCQNRARSGERRGIVRPDAVQLGRHPLRHPPADD